MDSKDDAQAQAKHSFQQWEAMAVKSPHALLIPFPAQGHVIPLLELSYCLIDHGFTITFVNTEFNHDLVVAAMAPRRNAAAGEVGDRQIRLVKITDGMAAGENRNDIGKLCDSILEVMPGALEELIGRINESAAAADDYGKITCVIADGSMAWAISVARKMGIPNAAFWPVSVGCLATVWEITSMIQDGVISSDGKPIKHGMIKLSPTMPEIDPNDFFWLCNQDPDSQQKLFRYAKHVNRHVKAADWLLCNSFYDIEQPACQLVGGILPIGPLIAGRREGRVGGNFWQEDSTCLSWLDKQPVGSVIYVAFGSLTIFTQHQFRELALGLQLSGKRFLWAVRPGLTGGSEAPYPDGFVARVADRGQIVGWSPQQKVLAHPAIACFFTHCGWNSTMEGLRNGVPFLCWPYFTDQFLHKAYITDVWKVGLEVKRETNGFVPQAEIKRKLEELLGDEEIMARSSELKALARKSIGKDGSSLNNLNNFIEAMKSKSC
ncbi:hypothetical protein ACLOJK_002440 [Asimina triloba]